MTASFYPGAEDEGLERIRTSVRLPREQHEDIELIAKLWNEFDKHLGLKRSKKWKAASVIERLVSVGIDGFWQQSGGRPESEQARKDWIAQALERSVKKPGKK